MPKKAIDWFSVAQGYSEKIEHLEKRISLMRDVVAIARQGRWARTHTCRLTELTHCLACAYEQLDAAITDEVRAEKGRIDADK